MKNATNHDTILVEATFFNSDAVNLNDGGVYVVVNKFNWGKARQEAISSC